MTIVVLNPGRINDGVYSSYPVVVDENGNVSVVRVSENAVAVIRFGPCSRVSERYFSSRRIFRAWRTTAPGHDDGTVSRLFQTVDTDSLLKVKLYAFHESQQMERYRIRNFISNLNKTADD